MRRFALAVAAALLAGTARAQVPDTTPFLRVETGQHQAVINRTILLPDGKSLATVSDDKTARVWSLDGLKPRGVILPPIGLGDDGALDAIAASGRVLAIGGRIRYGDGFGVQFYRLSDLKLIGHRSQLPAPVSALKFSRDGRTLAVGMVGDRGLAFFDMGNGTQSAADTGYAGQVQWIDTDADGRTVASGEDGHIRLYGPDHRKIAEATLPQGERAYAVTFSPDDRTIAAGVQNSPVVWLLDAANLHRIRSFTGAAARIGGFEVVAFAPDGTALYGAGTYKASATSPRLVRRWALNGAATDIDAGRDTVTDLVPLDRSLVLSDAEPALALLNQDGHVEAAQVAQHIDFRDAGITGLAVSADGTAVQLPIAGGTAVFDARQRTLTHGAATSATVNATMARPSDRGEGLTVSAWRNTTAPRLDGRVVALDRDEISLATAVEPNGSGAAFGTNFYVRFIRRDGTAWRSVVAAPAWAVNVSADGRLVVAGLGDGTLCWFDAASGNLLLQTFVEPSTGHWVMSTPAGFFDHDQAPPDEPDGRNLVGYRFNEPSAQISHFVRIGQFYPVFYRPDLVGLALLAEPAAQQAINQAHENHGPVLAVIGRGLPAKLTLLDVCGHPAESHASGCPATRTMDTLAPPDHPGMRLATTAAQLTVRFNLSNPEGQAGTARIFRDQAAILPALFTADDDEHSLTQEALIPLGEGKNTIRLLPVSTNGEVEGSDAAAVQFTVWRTPAPVAAPSPAAPPPHLTTLYLLSVGVSTFSHKELELPNARNDAQAVAALMGSPDPPLYQAVDVTTLYDAQATVANITDALKAITRKARPDDRVMVFFAGHGQEVDGKYYFAPADLGTRNPELFQRALAGGPSGEAAIDQLFRTEGLGPNQLLPLVQALTAARVALVLDTCYSASLATQDAVLQRDMNSTVANSIGHMTGRFVLSGATTLALDSPGSAAGGAENAQGHGMFTGYLLAALEGSADLLHSGRVDVVQLANFTIANVKRATATMQQKQEPTFFFEGSDFFALRTDRSQ